MLPLSTGNLACYSRCRGARLRPVPVFAGIAHIGVGGFHRAHQAMYLDRLMNAGLASDWGICGVGVLPSDRRMADVFAAQDNLYTLVVKHPDGTPRTAGHRLHRRLPLRPRRPRRRRGPAR